MPISQGPNLAAVGLLDSARQWLRLNLEYRDGEVDKAEVHRRYTAQMVLQRSSALNTSDLGKKVKLEFPNVGSRHGHRHNFYVGISWKSQQPPQQPVMSPPSNPEAAATPSPPPAPPAKRTSPQPSTSTSTIRQPLVLTIDDSPPSSPSHSRVALVKLEPCVIPQPPPLPQSAQRLAFGRLVCQSPKLTFPLKTRPVQSSSSCRTPVIIPLPPPIPNLLTSSSAQSLDTSSQPQSTRLQPLPVRGRKSRSPSPRPNPRPQDPNLGHKLASLKMSVPTLRRVPRGARIEVATALTTLLDEVATDNSPDAWSDLLFFPYAVLQVPQASEGVRNLTTWVKERVRLWKLDRGAAVPNPRQSRSRKTTTDPSQLAKKVEAKLADGDVRGSLRLLESDDTLAPHDDNTLKTLRDKHPAHPEPVNYPERPSPMPVVLPTTAEELQKGIMSFPPGSAGGLDALRPAILKDLISRQSGDAGEKLLASLCKVTDVMLEGKVPAAVVPFLFGASLTALTKKGGGIRPIAVGCTLRRLVSKVLVHRLSKDLAAHLAPHQLGVGVRGGAEIGAHAARAYFNAHHEGPKAYFKADFENAFNKLRRDLVLARVLEFAPSAYPFVAQAYGSTSNLYFGTTVIESRCGVQQGDPLGPAIFALVVQPIINAIDAELNLWFLDDSSLGDSPEVVLAALGTLIRESHSAGLNLNPAKCEVALLGTARGNEQIMDEFRALVPGVIAMKDVDAMQLGSPLTDSALERVLEEKTKKFESAAVKLQQLTAHSAFYLLRASTAMPRLQYFLRCAPAFKKRTHLEAYDQALKTTLERVLNCALNPEAWLQSSLPVKLGGLGIRHAVDTAIPSFIASCYSVLPGVAALLPAGVELMDADVEEAMDRWTAMVMPLERPPENQRREQQIWEQPLFALAASQLRIAAATAGDKARLLATIQPEVGAWLQALPSPQLGTHMSNETFRIASAIRLGCEICQPHRCPCGVFVDSRGLHGLSCRNSAGRQSRHGACNDVISRALRTAEVPNIKEPSGCSWSDGTRPDGLTLVPWTRGRCLAWDYTCADTFAPSHLRSSSVAGGRVASEAARLKRAKYQDLCQRYIFVPVAMETAGVWDLEGLNFVKEIGRRLSVVSGEPRSTSFLLQRMSIAVQRGNVAAVLGSLPAGAELDEIFLF